MAYCKEPRFGSCSAKAKRSSNQPLFPSPVEGKKYYFKAEVNKQLDKAGDSDFSLMWNRTDSIYVKEVSAIFS